MIAAIGVAVAAVVVVIVLAAVVNSRPVGSVDDPLAVPAAEAPGAGTPACAALAAALPDQLGGLPRRTIEHGDDPSLTGVAAWGEPAVILRCGVPTPIELTCSAAVQEVDGVAWLPLSIGGDTTYLVVDRAVRVALTVPDSLTSTGPWQDAATLVAATLPQRAICENGQPLAADGESTGGN